MPEERLDSGLANQMLTEAFRSLAGLYREGIVMEADETKAQVLGEDSEGKGDAKMIDDGKKDETEVHQPLHRPLHRPLHQAVHRPLHRLLH